MAHTEGELQEIAEVLARWSAFGPVEIFGALRATGSVDLVMAAIDRCHQDGIVDLARAVAACAAERSAG